MNLLLAALLVLRLNPGNAEVEDDEEEITQFLFDYAARFSDDLTEYYYYDNSTAIPTMYTYEMDSYEDSQDSAGSALQCHLPLVTLLSLLGLLL